MPARATVKPAARRVVGWTAAVEGGGVVDGE